MRVANCGCHPSADVVEVDRLEQQAEVRAHGPHSGRTRGQHRPGEVAPRYGRVTVLAGPVTGWRLGGHRYRFDRQRCHRPGLQQHQLSAAQRPFDVLWAALVLLDPAGSRGDRLRLVGVQDRLGCCRTPGRGRVADLPRLRRGLPGNQALAEAGDRLDHDDAAVAGDRIGGEGHSGRVCADHRLDEHCDPRRLIGAGPVRADPVSGRRRPALPHRVEQALSGHVQHCGVEAGV
jgi:hypothetical protein